MRKLRAIVMVLILISVIKIGIEAKETNGPLYMVTYNTTRGMRYGFVDTQGEFIIQPIYTSAKGYYEGYGIVAIDEAYSIIDATGKPMFSETYKDISYFHIHKFIATTDRGTQVIDQYGKSVTTKLYDHIEPCINGYAVVGEKIDGKMRYGYIDINGFEVIAPKYLSASQFENRKALVQFEDNKYGIITPEEKVKCTLDYPVVGGFSEGRMYYQETSIGLKGILDDTGKVIIPPSYGVIEPYLSGVTVVAVADTCVGKRGLVDLQGEIIYGTFYNEIRNIGNKRVALGKPITITAPEGGSIFALADTQGHAKTDFIYYGLDYYDTEFISAYTGDQTFLLTQNGEMNKNFRPITGSGILEPRGELIKATIDFVSIYMTQKGALVYAPNRLVELPKGESISLELYRPSMFYVNFYPLLTGMKDKIIEASINKKMYELTQKSTPEEAVDKYVYCSMVDLPYAEKDLLVVEINDKKLYPCEPYPWEDIVHVVVDLETGQIFSLSDLFLKNTNWQRYLEELISIEALTLTDDLANLEEDDHIHVSDTQDFYVDQTMLYVCYEQHELKQLGGKNQAFAIPFDKLQKYIDKEGSLWKSFH